jgi:hypothetical protein
MPVAHLLIQKLCAYVQLLQNAATLLAVVNCAVIQTNLG